MFNWCHRYTSIKTSFFTLIPYKTLSRLPRGMSPGKVSWGYCHLLFKTWMPSCHWQTRATRKHAQNCSSSTWKQVEDELTTCLK